MAQTLVVNEWVAKNSTGITDEDGDCSDWIELYNGGTDVVDLSGYGLSDNDDEPYKWAFPSVTIPPNGFLLVFCSDKNRVSGPFLHTNFKLSDDDELALTDPLGNTLQYQPLTNLPYDVSQGSIVDGSSELKEYYGPTPNSSNLHGLFHDRIQLSHPSGFHPEPFLLTISSSESNDIRYTTDGSEPNESDPIFSSFIQIDDRSSETLDLSSIPTTAPNMGPEALWEMPEPEQFKGTVLRFRSFQDGIPSSHIITASYFVHPSGSERYSLPVVSIITDSLNLFQYDSGIYVPGLQHDLDPDGGGTWGTGNFHETGDEWERKAHVQIFDSEGGIELDQQLGIRIHGTGSRALAQKSLRFHARSVYGESKMEHQFFESTPTNEFEVLVLSNMGQDFLTGVAQDVLANRLLVDMYQAKLADRPFISFINGEYWGIQNLRERYDKHFLSAFHQLDEDSVDIIDTYFGSVSMGDNVAFFELYNFIENNDLSLEQNYAFVEERMHVLDFIDNTLTRIYLGCYDWPGNNFRIWRERSDAGRFRWLLLDTDGCLGNFAFNSLVHATNANGSDWPNPKESTLFLRKLLENDGFKQQFVLRMAKLLNTAFNRSTVATQLRSLYYTYQPEYDEHDARWKVLNETTLYENYDEVMEVVRIRSCYVREHFIDFFNLHPSEFPYDCDSSELFLDTLSLELEDDLLLVYPNPNNGLFHVQLPVGLNGALIMKIMDLSGSVVFLQSKTYSGGEAVKIGAEHLASGIYLLQISNTTEAKRSKLIIR